MKLYLVKATMIIPDARLSAVFAGVFVVAYVIWMFVRDSDKRGTRLPPTIWSLPFIGSVLFLPDYSMWHREFIKLSKKLGNVFAFYLGSR